MNLQPLAPYLGAIEIVMAIVLVALVVLQSKGSDMSAFMGGGGGGDSFRTKRGLEATLHRVTIWFSVVFFIVTILAFVAWGQVA